MFAAVTLMRFRVITFTSRPDDFRYFGCLCWRRVGNLVTAEIEVLDESPLGVLFDCHIEFASNGERGGPIVFEK